MPDRRKVERAVNILFGLALLLWITGAVVIAVWEICHPPVTVNGTLK